MALLNPPLRPVSDDTVLGTVVKTPNVAAWQNVDDAPSDDATYVTSAFTGSGVYFGLSDITLTGTQRVKQVKLRARFFHNSVDVGHEDSCDLRLRDSVTGKNSVKWTAHTFSNTAVEDSSGWYTADPNGKAWSETVVDRLQISTAWVCRSTGLTQLRISELYVDVDIRDQPAVSAVTVTGATSGTRPSYSYTYTPGNDATDVQIRRQVKVFSSTQYGAAGFNPATSASIWDSGVLTGSATSGTVGQDLLNGLTYKVYVRAAKAWVGPAGTLWWSDWVASSAFSINLLPPVTPTLTAALDTALPGYRVILNTVAPINLLTLNQASLETDTTGWAALTNNTISRSTAVAADGAASLQMSSTAAGTMTAETSTRPPVLAGGQYTAMGSVRSAASVRTVRVGIRWYDQAGSLIGSTNFGSTASSSTSAFVLASSTQTAPANAYTGSVVLEVQSTAAGAELHRWDKIGLQAGSSTSWTAGGGQSSAQVLVERLVRCSTERGASKNLAHPQLVSGGGLTMGTDGFVPRLTSLIRSAPMDGPPPAGLTGGGARMIVWHPLVGAFNGLDIGLDNVATSDPAPPYLLPAVPGVAMTYSVYLRGSSAVSARVYAIPVDVTNVQVGSGTETVSASANLPTSGWSRYTVANTAPAGTAFMRMMVELVAGNADLDVSVTGVQAELGSTASTLAPGTGDGFAVWDPVRQLESVAPVSPGERFTIIDHEAPPGVPVLYRASTQVTASTGDILSSLPSTALAVVLTPPARTLAKDPFQPENAAIVNVWPGDNSTVAEDVAELHALGRDGDPVFLRSWLGREWAGELSALSNLEWHRLLQLLPSSRPLLVQFPEGGQSYVRVRSWSAERTRPGYYKTISITGAVTARPS